MWPFYPAIAESELSVKDKMSYLRMISFSQNLPIQSAADLKVMEENITALISSPLTRYNGLVLWSCAITKSKLYLPNWGKLLLAGLQCKDSFAVKEQCTVILKKMILTFGSNAEYMKGFFRYLPDIVPVLLSDSEANQGFMDSCNSLALCMAHFPHLLGSHMGDIESFVIKNLNTDTVPNIEALADCFAAFPKCLMYKLKPKPSYKDVCYSTFVKTLNTLNLLLNDIASFHNGNLVHEDLQPNFEIPSEENEEIPLMFNKIRCVAVLSRCLAKLMSCETSKIRAPIADLLLVIQKMVVFDLNEQVQVNNPNSELALLFLVFPKICDAAFTLLEALVINFPVHEQVTGIMSLVARSLHLSRNRASLFYSQVRLTTWKFLHIWIQQSGSKVISEINSKLINDLLTDISLQNSEVNDQVVEMLQNCNCMEALKVLNSVLISGSCFLETKDLEDVSSSVIQTIRKIQLYLNPSKTFPCPYTNENCRLELYNLLLTCSITGNESQMKTTLRSINLFKIALRDPSMKVKEVCHRAFAICRYYLHPKKPPPDCTLPMKPIEVANHHEEDHISVDWEPGWQNGQLNGHVPEDSLAIHHPHSSYGMESNSYQEPMEEGEIIHADDSPPHYTPLEPVAHKRTLSSQSSRSYNNDESDSEGDIEEEEKEDSSEEEEEKPASYSRRQNIPTPFSTGPRGTSAPVAEEHPEEKVVESEDEVMVENGEEDEDVEEEEEEDEEVEEEEKAEEPPIKKQRVEEEEVVEEVVQAKDEDEEEEEMYNNNNNDEEDEEKVISNEVISNEVQEEEGEVEAEGGPQLFNGEVEEDSEESDPNEQPPTTTPILSDVLSDVSGTIDQLLSIFGLIERD